jgi:hypothetical protein
MRSDRDAVRFYSDSYMTMHKLLSQERPDLAARPDAPLIVLVCTTLRETERLCDLLDHEVLQNIQAFSGQRVA